MLKIIVIEITKKLINSESFMKDHRANSSFFTRERKLTFPRLLSILLQKSVKPLQVMLNEVMSKLDSELVTVSNSAFSQARAKLLHTAFIELNEKAIIEPFYKNGEFKTWRGFRVLAVDGSKIILPDTKDIRAFFGVIKIKNQVEGYKGSYPCALASVLYDVLNNIPIDARISHAKESEYLLARQHLSSSCSEENDLMLYDRNYTSYIHLARHIKENRHFVCRCSRSSFKGARILFNSNAESIVSTLRPSSKKLRMVRDEGLPAEIKVRFVKVILDNGEVEVLVTSLPDESLYTNNDFKELYRYRWGIETFYAVIKERLNLENFTGKSLEAVKQDFHSTIFISALESVLTQDSETFLEQRSAENKYPQSVNKAVSFNTIKNNVFHLLLDDAVDINETLSRMEQLFITSPCCTRKGRETPRKKTSANKKAAYYKRRKKPCF